MKRTILLISIFLVSALFADSRKVALIFGVTGQDGAYLAELLLSKNYKVYGVKRRSSSHNTARIDHIYESPQANGNFSMFYGDLTDSLSVLNIIQKTQPDEIYNLGAQSHVRVSFDIPEYTAEVDALGTLRILEAIKILGLEKKTKFYQASTSELYGLIQEPVQSETTPFHPRSPYGVAKIYGYWITINYREAYNVFACNGILFNHESPRRGPTFVTRKITQAAASIKLGLQNTLYLGNLDSKRDWGYAKDYVQAMWLMLQQEEPDDYVIATGETHSVREFTELAFKEVGIELIWQGDGVNEIGIDKSTNKVIVRIDPRYFRPSEVDLLLGNAKKAKNKLKWTPSTTFQDLVKIMVMSDYKLALSKKNNSSK